MTSVMDVNSGHRTHFEVFDPIALSSAASTGAQVVDTLDNKHVSIMANGWASWVSLRHMMVAELQTVAPSTTVRSWDVPLGSKASAQVLADISEQSDAVVIGLANCGSCAVSLAANAAFLMGSGLPVVAVVTERFQTLVESLQPELPLIVLPAALEQLDELGLKEIETGLWARLEGKIVGEG